jgi:hypothetical protein
MTPNRAPATPAGPLAGTEPDRSWVDAWAEALHVLELDVSRCEDLLRAVHAGSEPPADPVLGAWAPPADLGPLPDSLEERARTVLARQLDVAAALTAAAAQSRQQMALVGRLDIGVAPARPMYVDAVF